ncbi:type II secretion system protein GspK [Methylomarinum vadi]|uniref:type II secretion system protein GspK n=1 Tax=Methylomarinum vadi TaxID=438855 RepID=UPI0004DFB983|nr:type II secretion system protein GspK [Methylomarinum vadi]
MAVSVYLAVVIKQAKEISPPGANQMSSAIAEKQVINILQFALSRTYSDGVPVDPRYVKYRSAVQSNQSDPSKNQNVQFLRELLSQMGMELNLDKKNDQSNLSTSASEDNGKTDEGAASQQGILYTPRQRPFTLSVNGADYEISVLPIDSRPNINYLQSEALERYLVFLGIDPSKAKRIAYAIADWVDSDDFISDEGVEFNYYLNLDHSYRPRNNPIRSWGELFYIKDVTPDLVHLMKQHFTYVGEERQVCAKYLAPESLAALADIPVAVSRQYFDYQQLPKKDNSLQDLIGNTDIEKIAKVADWDCAESQFIIMRIKSVQAEIEGVFDKKQKQLASWRLL